MFRLRPQPARAALRRNLRAAPAIPRPSAAVTALRGFIEAGLVDTALRASASANPGGKPRSVPKGQKELDRFSADWGWVQPMHASLDRRGSPPSSLTPLVGNAGAIRFKYGE
jgi:hypothetical protein